MDPLTLSVILATFSVSLFAIQQVIAFYQRKRDSKAQRLALSTLKTELSEYYRSKTANIATQLYNLEQKIKKL